MPVVFSLRDTKRCQQIRDMGTKQWPRNQLDVKCVKRIVKGLAFLHKEQQCGGTGWTRSMLWREGLFNPLPFCHFPAKNVPKCLTS